MQRILLASVALLASLQVCAADVGVSVTVGQPGFYGRLDISDFPHPELMFSQAVIVKPVVGVIRPPIYLHVPPGHTKDWAKHCGRYGACGERVYFVHDHWYNDVYVRQSKKRHGGHKGENHVSSGKGHGNAKN